MEKTEFEKKIEDLVKESSNGKDENPIKKAPRYDPTKNYRWEPETQFLVSGNDFGLILNSVRNVLLSPEAQAILRLEQAAKALENSLARAIEIGLVKESDKIAAGTTK